MFTGENILKDRLVYRGYRLELTRRLSGWSVGVYPRTADLPILSRCEIVALDQHEALATAKHRVDSMMSV